MDPELKELVARLKVGWDTLSRLCDAEPREEPSGEPTPRCVDLFVAKARLNQVIRMLEGLVRS